MKPTKIYYTKKFNMNNKCNEVFIYIHATLEYFNFKKENGF